MFFQFNKITKGFHYRAACLCILFTTFRLPLIAQVLTGFEVTGNFKEQEYYSENFAKDVAICINAPLHFNKRGKTFLVLYALPNGNSIEWTKGKKIKPGDDWHFDIQHIAAQMRYVRSLDKKNNYIVAYLMAANKSWPAWKRATLDSKMIIKKIVDSLNGMFITFNPKIVLNGHSGGGSFIFGYLDIVSPIPSHINRIAFLDSDYGYEDSLHTKKLSRWLTEGKSNNLIVLAYNDSVVVYNGKPLVSPTGGTWYRSRLMQRKLETSFPFSANSDTSMIKHLALNGRIQFLLKENPKGLIYHTIQVEKNGFILSLLSGSGFDNRKYFSYFGKRVYEKFFSD